ncbi:hypothetical protein K7X08_014098 [Anisodus acutangulus]|uniref:PRELI/MSF1 domain-containing protein n=1 Tax=Anisodus acutangulus TaxID=402998 RepID=A0A9Q1R4R0_9SOLA|nr:hypothetical protein K7X08_014098 [Anisodus acutangulus]
MESHNTVVGQQWFSLLWAVESLRKRCRKSKVTRWSERIHKSTHIRTHGNVSLQHPGASKLYTTRAITIHAPGPWFIRKIIGQDICHCVESTVVDAQSRSMQLSTRNISLEKYIEVEEKIRYDPHPDNPNLWTVCKQETSIRIKPLLALASMAEKIEQKCVDKFQANSAKGREVMERMCKYLEAESRGISA